LFTDLDELRFEPLPLPSEFALGTLKETLPQMDTNAVHDQKNDTTPR
jgi:hypothetical protein